MEIKDIYNNLVNCIPVVLVELQETPPITLRIFPGNSGEFLESNFISGIIVAGKIGGGSYQDLYAAPLFVGNYFPGYVDIEIKIISEAEVSGVVRTNVFLGGKSGKSAGWET